MLEEEKEEMKSPFVPLGRPDIRELSWEWRSKVGGSGIEKSCK